MSALPAGTVTFVFTDIEGSTALLKALGEQYGAVLSQHRRLIRGTFGADGGTEIDTQGDAFFFAFPRSRDAVAASVAVQREHAAAEWPGGATVRVRIGLHTGEPAVGEEGYLGLDVVRAARICAVARGGNVLISETTRALLGSTLPDGVSVYPLGERHLKGIDEPERVYELEIEGVQSEHPQAETTVPPPEKPKSKKQKPKRDRESEFEQRMEQWATNLSERIQERVYRTLDKRLPKAPESVDVPPPEESADLDDLAARADAFEERIRARVEEAMKASGVPPDQM
jgi:class 3 adenylate cyclase